MPIVSFGPRAQRVHALLRERIMRGELAVGDKLPAHTALAVEYGVSPLTMRQVLARLEADGLVAREHGRGTFVRPQTPPAVLIVAPDAALRALLVEQVTHAGYDPLTAPTADEGLARLETDRTIALVFSAVHLPDPAAGHAFIRAVRRRWPTLAVVALTSAPEDLTGLHGTAEWPILVVPIPFWPHQIEEILRLVLQR